MDRFVIAWAIDLQWFQLDISGVKIEKVGGSRPRPVVLLVPFLDQSRTTASYYYYYYYHSRTTASGFLIT